MQQEHSEQYIVRIQLSHVLATIVEDQIRGHDKGRQLLKKPTDTRVYFTAERQTTPEGIIRILPVGDVAEWRRSKRE